MNKVVYNGSFGGFGLSDKAKKRLRKHGITDPYEVERHNPILIQCVEELGIKVNDFCSDLRIEEINGDRYWIQDYDGMETVYTPETIDWVVIKEEERK